MQQPSPFYTIGGSKGVQGTCTPPGYPNSFDFMQFSGKFGKIICWRPHLPPRPRVGTPSSGKSWIHHCMPYTVSIPDPLCYTPSSPHHPSIPHPNPSSMPQRYILYHNSNSRGKLELKLSYLGKNKN